MAPSSTGALLAVLAMPALASGEPGEGLYERFCLPCHGEAGDGLGPAARLLTPAPRDFTRGVFKLRSTPSGTSPSLPDLERSIARGVPGTDMPAWQGTLTAEQIRALAQRVRSFSTRPARPAQLAVGLPQDPAPGDAGRGRLAWERGGCSSCHGPTGRGDGPSAAGLRHDDGRPALPYSLADTPFRGGSGILDLVRTLSTGMDGTPMPAYREAFDDQTLVDLAVYLRTLQSRELLATPAPGGAALALLDVEAGLVRELPSVPDGEAMRGYWRFPIPPQGPAPPHLTPAEAAIDPQPCGRCHAEQLRAWSSSPHARTHGPGFTGQMHDAEPRFVFACHRCHAPMTEQVPFVEVEGALEPNRAQVPGLADAGVTCAACHLRAHVRHGPTPAEPRRIVPPSYPLRVAGRFERSDVCLTCHQHSLDIAVAGKPPLDTYREWLGSAYFRRGYQCQSCHMPERAHTWKGIHDPATVRQALDVEPRVRRAGAEVQVTVRLSNVGAGHMLPTTPTPALFVHVSLVDPRGNALPGQHQVADVLRRELTFVEGSWSEVRDTRIAPGASRTARARFTSDRGARAVRIEVEVRPDFHYEALYRDRLARAGARARRDLRAALDQATGSSFVVFRRDLLLPR